MRIFGDLYKLQEEKLEIVFGTLKDCVDSPDRFLR